MKTLKNKSVSKLIASFDNELKAILMSDLKIIRGTKTAIVRNIQQRDQLSVA